MALSSGIPFVRRMELGPIASDETPAILAAIAAAFLADLDEEEAALEAKVIEPERTLVAREDGRIVACAAVLSRELTVPGGRMRSPPCRSSASPRAIAAAGS